MSSLDGQEVVHRYTERGRLSEPLWRVDDVVLSCDSCGALVMGDDQRKHSQWHLHSEREN